MGIVSIARAFRGLNNKVDPARLQLNLETGVADLAECVNLRFDQTGRGKRRAGTTMRHGGEFYSLWARGTLGYVGLNDAIYKINLDLSLTGVVSGLAGTRISYCWTPLGVYYVNSATGLNDKGILEGDAARAWVKSDGAREDSPRYYTGPPDGGSHLELFASRMLIAKDNSLVYSQPNDYGLYRLSSDFNILPTRICMVRAVAGGVYLSDQEKTYFVTGTDPKEWTRRTVMECPAMEWSDMTSLVSPKVLGMEGDDGWACWVSADGLVFGSPQGQILQPTEEMINVPTGFKTGAAVLDGENVIYNWHQ